MSKFYRWLMEAPAERLVQRASEAPEPARDEVRIRVAGCGVCHTDLGFLYGGVRPRHALPLALGHEIAGVVEAAGEEAGSWLGRPVVLPAVLPCGACALCAAGRETACPRQRMPGNDFHGGFASHVVAPARWLVDVGDLPDGLELQDLAVLADAITTPYQALLRAEVGAGDAVVVIGAGGIGSFAVQIAAALGAAVVAVDVREEKVARATSFGAREGAGVQGLDARASRKAVQEACARAELPATGWKVFEMSGTTAGQALAWSLLTPAGIVGVVGFCLEKVPIRLSRLMALDAGAFGSWGCRPQLYEPALELVRSGAVQVRPFVQRFPMSEINTVLEEARHHRIPERPVLVP